MVASALPRDFDVYQPSHTEQLSNWISRVRCKKFKCRRNRKRDLRVEAVLTSALCKAENELRIKQINRINKWQQLKKQFLKDCTRAKHEDNRKDSLCPELSSLNDFMSKLGEIKVPLQR